ncbi:MAG: SDR family NAD(P)-dependent oxidoreductase [Chloroflexota bacterium]|nr:SDR family NAD(P)-dependent oxidoreductase [Chloroflexota bacterium]
MQEDLRTRLFASPHLKRAGRGALIHISSGEAILTPPYQSSYAASKHGIKGFLDGLRIELEHEGIPISVTNIMPATINTPLYDKARTKIGVRPIGYPPVYEPGIVADAILQAAEHPTREVIVGGSAKVGAITRRVAPRLVVKLLGWTGFYLQRTNPSWRRRTIISSPPSRAMIGLQATIMAPRSPVASTSGWPPTPMHGVPSPLPPWLPPPFGWGANFWTSDSMARIEVQLTSEEALMLGRLT